MTVRSESGAGKVTVVGTVLDRTGAILRVRSGDDVREFAADRVVEVETPRLPQHVDGLKAYNAGRHDDAKRLLAEAVAAEPRPWMRREILAAAVRVELARGDRAAAGSHFLSLLEGDPQTRHFPLLPLEWRFLRPDPALAAAARGWLRTTDSLPWSAASRLLGASVLLSDPASRAEAKEALDRLAANADRRIYPLARAQLWRLAVADGPPPAGELDRWEDRLSEIPESLRGGGHYVVGLGRAARQDHERAATALLWLPLVYDADSHLAADAAAKAAASLAAIGRTADAVVLYREVLARFPQTPAAGEAKEGLASLAGPPARATSADE